MDNLHIPVNESTQLMWFEGKKKPKSLKAEMSNCLSYKRKVELDWRALYVSGSCP